jgi:hypothetical protein
MPISPVPSYAAPNLRAMGEVVERPGHRLRATCSSGTTHRSGPNPDDDDRRLAGAVGVQLTNTGCWVYESMYLDRHWGSPYWPGGAVELEERR